MLFCILDIGRTVLVAAENSTGSFPVWFPAGCSLATTSFCAWVPFSGDVWLAIVVFCWVWVIIESILVLFRLAWFVMVSVGCCQTTPGLGGSFGISFFSGLSVAAPEWTRGNFSLKFGLQLGHSHLSCFEQFSVGLGFVLPAVYSEKAVC